MIRWSLLLTCLCLIGIEAPAQSDAPPSPLVTPWANKLFLPDIETHPDQPAPSEITHDFGAMPRGTLAIHKFMITNIYAVPMQITEIRRTSEIVQAYPPQRILQPNDKAEFIVTLDTSRFNAEDLETVQVTFGPTNISTATIRLKAISRNDVTLSPGSMNFGNIMPNTTPSKSVTLEYTGKQKDWKILGFVAPKAPFDVTLTEAGKGKTKITATLKKTTSEPGSLNDVVHLRTNDPTMPVITIHINGNLQALFDVPPKVTFPMMKLGETNTFRIVVRGNGTGPFKVEPLADSGDGLAMTLNASAPVQTIIVTFTPTKTGKLVRQVQLPTDLKSGATINLTIEAETMP
jgi:hypothetical protein